MDCSPPRLLGPWDFPGMSTGVGCHFLLQGIFPNQGSNTGLPHCRQMLYHLSYQGSPTKTIKGKYPAPRRAPGLLLSGGKTGPGSATGSLIGSKSFPRSSNLFSVVTRWPELPLCAAHKWELCVKMRHEPSF